MPLVTNVQFFTSLDVNQDNNMDILIKFGNKQIIEKNKQTWKSI